MSPESKRFVAYYRVSTEGQGSSGLGLEAQREKVRQYLGSNGWEIVDEFEEVESGTKSERPALEKALRACRLKRATLIVAKLDRLARNASLLHRLRDSSVEIRFADMPEASDLSVSVLAAVAEHEAEQISKRTREALEAAKDRGVDLGTPENLSEEGRAKGREVSARVRSERADQYAAEMAPVLEELKAAGATSLRAKAEALEEQGYRRPQGGNWSAMAVSRLEGRIENLEG